MSEQVVISLASILTETRTKLDEAIAELALSKAREMQLAKLLDEAHQELEVIKSIYGYSALYYKYVTPHLPDPVSSKDDLEHRSSLLLK